MFVTKTKSILLAGAVFCALGAAAPAMAQDMSGNQAQAADNEADTGPARLDTIMVTAQRRSQDVQDIPVTVSAFSSTMLEERQITETIDLSRSVPNLVSANNVLLGTSVTYFLRGTGSTESIATFDLPVGTYIDEVYISRQNANQIALSGVERVEVLRGPQGTLFGRNTTAGAVSIVTKKPSQDFEAEAEASYGSYDRITLRGAVNSPLSDTAAVRVSGFFVDDGGYLKSPVGGTLNGESSFGGRIAVRLEPIDTITWDLSAQYVNSESTGLGVPGVVNAAGAITPVSATGDLLVGQHIATNCEPSGAIQTWSSQNCLFNGVESTLFISNLGIDTGIGMLNFITGYSDIQQKFVLDNFAYTDEPILGGIFGPTFYLSNEGSHKQFSQELKLSGDTLGGDLEYVFGLFYLREYNETDVIDEVAFLEGGPVVFADRTIDNETESFAAYGQVDWMFAPNLTLQLGGRFTSETKEFGVNGTAFGAPLVTADLAAAGIPLELDVNRFTPRVALFYNVTPDTLLYASYTEGFKSGGWNARSFGAAGFVAFDPEYVKSYELGIKTDFLDGRGRLNATLFRADYSNLQVPAILPISTDFITVNAASSRVQGLELEGSILVTDGITLFSNIGLTDAEYRELTPEAIAASLGPKLQRTPDFTGQAGFVAETFVGGDNLIKLSADLQYTSSFETGPANTIAGSVGAETTVNAQLSWTLPNENWEIALACKNCTNNVYVVQELLGQIFANDPRRLTASVRFRY